MWFCCEGERQVPSPLTSPQFKLSTSRY
ncbi:hypothetical protein PanWU01x14_114680 [Parasponia andersonii]|uniref:Uncharacterized protein n=1 Tax=Parasponia andersonii TaxID=3476 RepID=A0A2P5CXL4_PARAD|nr:hypothetical protein PanWU01x14_114680 [Parasponia andersonii]